VAGLASPAAVCHKADMAESHTNILWLSAVNAYHIFAPFWDRFSRA